MDLAEWGASNILRLDSNPRPRRPANSIRQHTSVWMLWNNTTAYHLISSTFHIEPEHHHRCYEELFDLRASSLRHACILCRLFDDDNEYQDGRRRHRRKVE